MDGHKSTNFQLNIILNALMQRWKSLVKGVGSSINHKSWNYNSKWSKLDFMFKQKEEQEPTIAQASWWVYG